MFDLIGPFVVGLAGSTHCLGMCGPLILAYSLHLRPGDRPKTGGWWPGGTLHHVAFHTGRLFTYCLLGVVAAALVLIPGSHSTLTSIRSVVSVAGGSVMILLGLATVGIVPLRFRSLPAWGSGLFAGKFLRRLFSSPMAPSKLALGVMSGFLPCALTLPMIVQAASTGSLLHGGLTMLLFGLGTVPTLFLTGLSASVLSLEARLIGERIAGAAVIVMGAILVARGAGYLG